MTFRIPPAAFALLILATVQATAQPLPRISGNQSEIRNVTMNANNVTFIMYNYGQFARPNTLPNVADFVWRKLGYMYEFGPLLSAEVVDTSGQSVRILDDGLWFSSQGSYSPDGVKKWGWLPRAGYALPGSQRIPTLRDTTMWPSSWSEWPRLEGTTFDAGGNQAYYVMDDFTNAKYAYFPFPADSSKRGLGVSAQVWTTQYPGTLQDAVLITWRLKNESLRSLAKCYFGFYGDPHTGGTNDYADDLVSFIDSTGPTGDSRHIQARNTIYNFDPDGVGMFGLPTGYMSLKFLKTPGNHDLTAFSALPYGGSNFPKNDQLFSRLISGDSVNHTLAASTPGDYVLAFGTGSFALAPGDSTDITLAVFFSDSYNDMLDDASAIYYVSHWPSIASTPGQSGGDPACAIQITAPQPGIAMGDVQITWNYSGSDPTARVYLECSKDGGNQWTFLASDLDPSSFLTWHTASVRDGTRYLVRAVAYAPDFSRYAYSISGAYLTIDNPGNAQPEVELFAPAEGTVVQTPTIDIGWNARDADNSSLAIALFSATSPDGPFTQIHSGTYANGPADFLWDLSAVPNGLMYYLKITASDGVAETSYVSKKFAIEQAKGLYADTVFHHAAGKATIDLTLQVTDPSQLKGHTYELTFAVPSPDSAKRMTVRDITSSTVALSDFTLRAGFSTPAFDGVKLTVVEKPIDIDTLHSGFTRPELNGIVNLSRGDHQGIPLPYAKLPHDWVFVFNALDTLSNGHYLFPGDTAFNNYSKKVVICPFRITDLDYAGPVEFVVTNAQQDSLWRPGRAISVIWGENGTYGVACQVNLDFSSGPKPGAGDSLWVRTFKPVTSADTFRFTTDNSYVLGVPDPVIPTSFVLYQNYPNPFNPFTTIKYAVGVAGGGWQVAKEAGAGEAGTRGSGPVLSGAEGLGTKEDGTRDSGLGTRRIMLVVYDVLGRQVSTLVDEAKAPGSYEVSFDGSRLASGMYIYRLISGSYVESRKMMLLK